VRAKDEGNIDSVVEVLLSLRVNALQISPELRPNLIQELIKSDIFMIKGSGSRKPGLDLMIDLLKITSSGLKHATTALISVVASTQQGVEYLLGVREGNSKPDLSIPAQILCILID
jgi:hypothetical protein